MRTYSADVIHDHQVEYILEKDSAPQLSMDEDIEGYGNLVFYDEYRKPYDKDGYKPPKYLSEGLLYDIVGKVLRGLGRDDLEMSELDTTDDFGMETCYVFPEVVQQVKKSKLWKYKMTRYDVGIWKKDRCVGVSLPLPSSSSSEGEGDKETPSKKRKYEV